MADYQDRFVTANGLRFHYLEWGAPTAPPVVLLHGTTSTAHSWDRVSALLARRYRALAVDARDHGESDRSPAPYNRDTLVADLAAIVDALDLERFGLVGLSMGGRTAMLYAGLFPDRVERLVIEDIGPETPPEASAAVMARIAAMPQRFASLAEYVAWARQSVPYADEAWLYEKARHATRPLPDGSFENTYRRSWPTTAPLTTSVDLWAHLARISCPTLILRGAESEVLTAEIAARMVAVMPAAHEVVIPRAGHVVHEDNPEDSLRAYAEFFGIPLERTA
ncbi:MAG: alpha/beta hydrolase [Chloroflexi bacterium]|jgi:pimeloyl-ACP methyl ester carboxylesterase|nr:alpha/beta hydrolase [Chloroflexota bacterium]